MSVNSVSTGLPPPYNVLSGNDSQTAKSAALAQAPPEKTFAEADAARVASAGVGGTTQPNAAVASDAPGSQFKNTLEEALREGRATARKSTNGSSGSPGDQPSPGIALYQRIKQYGNNEPSTSALLKSWNNIMRGGQDADSAAAAFAKALSQNEALGSESGVLDLTA